jgi:MFS family permease
MLGGFLIFAITGALGLIVNDLDTLLLTRVAMGVAVAALVTSTTTLLSDFFTGEARSRLIGRQSVFMSGGSILFLLMGGFLASLGWRVPFAVYLVGLPMMFLAWYTIPEPARPGTTPSGIHNAAGSPPAHLLSPLFLLILFAAMAGMISFYQIPVQLPFFLRQDFGASPAVSGAAIALSTVLSALLATQFSRGLRRLGHALVMALAFCAVGAALGGLSLARHPIGVAASLSLLGCGLGWMMPNLTAWISHTAPPALRGRAMGLLGSSIFLGQFLAPVIAAPILASGGGFRSLFAIVGMGSTLIGLAFVAAGTTEVLRARSARHAHLPEE